MMPTRSYFGHTTYIELVPFDGGHTERSPLYSEDVKEFEQHFGVKAIAMGRHIRIRKDQYNPAMPQYLQDLLKKAQVRRNAESP